MLYALGKGEVFINKSYKRRNAFLNAVESAFIKVFGNADDLTMYGRGSHKYVREVLVDDGKHEFACSEENFKYGGI